MAKAKGKPVTMVLKSVLVVRPASHGDAGEYRHAPESLISTYPNGYGILPAEDAARRYWAGQGITAIDRIHAVIVGNTFEVKVYPG